MRVHKLLQSVIKNKKTRIGINFDPMPEAIAELPRGTTFDTFVDEIINAVAPYVAAFKINTQHMLLRLSRARVVRVVEKIKEFEVPVIVDHKLSDIGNSNSVSVHYLLSQIGFDGLTIHPLIGWTNGVEAIMREAEKFDAAVFSVVYMSHPGAKDFYELKVSKDSKPLYMKFVEASVNWGLTGVVIGATYPEKVEEICSFLLTQKKTRVVITTGYGVQGGDISAIPESVSGLDFLAFVGRSVLYAFRNPAYSHLPYTEASANAVRDFRDLLNSHLG
ncbi:MAG: hypothetical protein GTN80_02860 [Nitrososphaeria archaeon]|nr:hypothetical protein [Nitrososphaeria archaeon]NIN52113.1 hypothetical protein [Nitrososphaeria archaeon]NIQ32575.1 hypothetical protein [Nitrososphaeria archaeon]